jgi:hypothetical protein
MNQGTLEARHVADLYSAAHKSGTPSTQRKHHQAPFLIGDCPALGARRLGRRRITGPEPRKEGKELPKTGGSKGAAHEGGTVIQAGLRSKASGREQS